MIGQVIDQYKVVKVMGKTAIAESFLTVHTETGEKYVLKAVNRKLFGVSDFKRRLIDDSVNIIQLDHPNIVSLANVLDEGAAVFTVYEYLEGQSLDQIIKAKPAFPLANLAQLAGDVLAGISHAYQQGYTHHFLQPKKLIVTPQGSTRILDFGDVLQIAKEKYRKKDKLVRPALYFSPERFGNPGLSDVRTSIYSLGIILFEAATGKLPFVAKTYDELAGLHASHPLPDPRDLNSAVAPNIALMINKACSKRTEDRFQNLNEMRQALEVRPAESADVPGGFDTGWGSVGESSEESFDFGYENTNSGSEPASEVNVAASASNEELVAHNEFAADMQASGDFVPTNDFEPAPAEGLDDAAIEFEEPREKGGFAGAGADKNPDLISAHEFPTSVVDEGGSGFDFGTGKEDAAGASDPFANDDFGFGSPEPSPAPESDPFANNDFGFGSPEPEQATDDNFSSQGEDDPFGFGSEASQGVGDESFDTASDLGSQSGDVSKQNDFEAPQADIGFGFGDAESEAEDFGFSPETKAPETDAFGFSGSGPESGSDSFDFGSDVLDKNDGTFDFGTGSAEKSPDLDPAYNAAATVSGGDDGFGFDPVKTVSAGDGGFDFDSSATMSEGKDDFDLGAPESAASGFDFGTPEPVTDDNDIGGDGFDFGSAEPTGGGDSFDFGSVEPAGGGDGFDLGSPEPPGSGDGFDFTGPEPPGSGDSFDFTGPEPPGSGEGLDFGAPEPPGSGEGFDFGAPEPPGSGEGFDFGAPEAPGSGDNSDFLSQGGDDPELGEFNFSAPPAGGNESFDMSASMEESLGFGNPANDQEKGGSSFSLGENESNGFDFESAEGQGSAFDFDSAADPFDESGSGAAGQEEDAFSDFGSGFPSESAPEKNADNTFSTEDGAFSFEAVDDEAEEDVSTGKGSTFDEPELETNVSQKRTDAQVGLESSIAALEKAEKSKQKKAKKAKVVRKFDKKILAITGGLAALVVFGLWYFISTSQQSKRDQTAEEAIQNLVDESRFELAIAKLDEYQPEASSASKRRLKLMRNSIEDNKKSVEKQINTLLIRAREFEEQGKMLSDGKNDAFGQYRKILSMYANHPKATEQGERIKKVQIERADELLEAGDEMAALAVLKALNIGDREDKVIREKYKGLQERLDSERSDSLKASLENNFAKGRYELMLDDLEELDKIDSQTKFVKDMRRTLVNNFRQRGQEEMARRKFDAAEQSYNNALRLDPNNQDALRARDELTETKLSFVIEGKMRKLQRAVDTHNFKRQSDLAGELANLDPGNQSANSALDGVTAEIIRLRNEAEKEREKGHFKQTATLYKTIYEINGSEEARGIWLKLERWAPPPSMSYVPSSVFNMGSRVNPDSLPVRKILISSYFIDKYEVTNGQFKEFIDANPQWHPARVDPATHDGRYLYHWKNGRPRPDDLNRPVAYVSWYAARAYAQWRGKRLPTEAEWEKTAAGNTRDQDFWWGSYSDAKMAVYEFYEEKKAAAVGSFPANAYDVYEILGNVSEWVEDTYDSKYYWKAKNQSDPVNTASGEQKVLRGGSFKSRGRELALHIRNHNSATFCHASLGFRCAMVATAEP